ncbi:MAG TPA: hypothetical protein VJ546_04610 [Bacillales bacterium]|nr:hypothetical protein [Bacillales bacterium]
MWNQLSSEQKVRINGSWEDASVSTLIFHKNMIDSQKGKAYDGKEVVVMSFPTKDNRMPNNMIIYADKETLAALSYERVKKSELPSIKSIVEENRTEREGKRKSSKKRTEEFREKLSKY